MTTPQPPELRPSLWNPTAAACWSLLFTPVFGAFLHARNADVLGRKTEAKANRTWVAASFAYLVLTMVGDFVIPIPEVVYRGAAIGLLCGWYFSVGRKQVDYVTDELPSGYARKSWRGPLLVGLVAIACFFALDFVIQLIAEPSAE